jgi:hypothetical protein
MSNARAVRYRRLALEQEEPAKADLLLKIADESDRGASLHRRMAFGPAK